MKRLTTSDNAVKEFLFKDTSIEVVDEQARQDIDNLAAVAKSGDYDDLNNKPSLATVATTGDYDDLNNKPSLATVATTGSYDDLSNKPTIPIVNNGTLTIQKNGANVQTFTANDSNNKTANITVPTKVSELTNDSGYTTNTGTVTQVKVGNTAYDPSSGIVSLPAYPTVNNATLTIQKNGTNVQTFTANASSNVTANITMSKSDVGLSDVGNFKAVSTVANQGLTEDEKGNARSNIGAGSSSFSGDYNDLSNKPALKTVATSGSYNDLTNKPTIPVVNNATLTIQKNGTNVQTFTANASTNKTANITVPTKVSELTNDSGYTTNTGTVTQVKVGTTAYDPSSGVVSLPAYPTDTNNRRVFYGTCSTAAATAAKVITLSDTTGWELKAGTTVVVRFTNTNTASSVTLNVNSSGAKSIYYNNAAYTGSSSDVCGYAKRTYVYTYDGTYWVWVSHGVDNNTTYSSKAAASGGTDVSLVTTGEKYTWNNKGTGTVTSVKVGSTSYSPSSGVVSLPAYPTVNNATLTIQKNGTTVKTFTANASSNVTANITVPTKVSELTNDSGYITSAGTATNVSGTVAIAHGGTGATTYDNARSNLGVGTNKIASATALSVGTHTLSSDGYIICEAGEFTQFYGQIFGSNQLSGTGMNINARSRLFVRKGMKVVVSTANAIYWLPLS